MDNWLTLHFQRVVATFEPLSRQRRYFSYEAIIWRYLLYRYCKFICVCLYRLSLNKLNL